MLQSSGREEKVLFLQFKFEKSRRRAGVIFFNPGPKKCGQRDRDYNWPSLDHMIFLFAGSMCVCGWVGFRGEGVIIILKFS